MDQFAGFIVIMLVAVISHYLQRIADVVIHQGNGFKLLLQQAFFFLVRDRACKNSAAATNPVRIFASNRTSKRGTPSFSSSRSNPYPMAQISKADIANAKTDLKLGDFKILDFMMTLDKSTSCFID